MSEKNKLLLVVDQLESENVSDQTKKHFNEVIISFSGKYCGPIITLDLESTIQALQSYFKKDNLQSVSIINTSEANTEVAAELRQYFNISGLTPSEARLFTDKSLISH
ncbi:hypothetical protein [Piscirickettsia litoralis]|uniref:Uncharacterized protein n=1 Tax=Piscirickettsia litoralis TaxID=1891921 RepID=A0ABX3A425_9GAMM|nr:hypothetical protein [Piscirickettsia litoralis]ODN42190.1 hypothetical protein BGC07_03605 [Piscirickettsia litoralis]